MKRIFEVLGINWCKMAHAQPMWPVNGYYRCRVCLRTHPVHWERRKDMRQPPGTEDLSASPALALPQR